MNGYGWSADDLAALLRLVAASWTYARIRQDPDRARETVQRKRVVRRLKVRRMAGSLP